MLYTEDSQKHVSTGIIVLAGNIFGVHRVRQFFFFFLIVPMPQYVPLSLVCILKMLAGCHKTD